MKPHTLPSNIPAAVLLWAMLFLFKLGWWLVRLLWRKSWSALVTLLLAVLFANPADAGWFTRKPDPAIEAANRALQQAAQTANEAARIQGEQNVRIAEAITQLSGERAQLAGHLERLRDFSARDSAWAAALAAMGPVIVVALVLAVGGVALWLVTRSGPADAQLVDVLLAEVTGDGPRWLGATRAVQPVPLLRGAHAALNSQPPCQPGFDIKPTDGDESDPGYDNAPDSLPHTTEEYPF
jgi:hypothetical protein